MTRCSGTPEKLSPSEAVTLSHWQRLLPGLWAGLLLGVALLATPAPFATLLPSDAGRVVAVVALVLRPDHPAVPLRRRRLLVRLLGHVGLL